MTDTHALQQIAALKPGDPLGVDGRSFIVSTNTQGVVEFYPSGCKDMTGSYRRASHANVEALVHLGRLNLDGSLEPPRTLEGPL